MALKATAEDIDIGAVFAHFHAYPFVKGQLNLIADLKSAGSSPKEIATALEGELGVAVENGQIKRNVDLMGADAVGFMMAVRATEEYQDLNCMTLRFLFERGVGQSEVIYLETPDLYAKGVGKIDFHSETMNVALQPKSKKGFAGASSAVKIEGPIIDPKVRKLPFREAAKLYGEIAMPMIFLPLRGLGYLLHLIKKDKPEESPCFGLRPSESESGEVR
jgi:uncharacterized protein involved in outer membrane biogenesis